MCADKTDKNGSCLKYNPYDQTAVIAFDIKDKQSISHGIHTVKVLFYIIESFPVGFAGNFVPTL